MATALDFEQMLRGAAVNANAHADVDCTAGETPCLTASDDHRFSIDEAEVIYRGLCAGICQVTEGI